MLLSVTTQKTRARNAVENSNVALKDISFYSVICWTYGPTSGTNKTPSAGRLHVQSTEVLNVLRKI